jgi:hypothetical protein
LRFALVFLKKNVNKEKNACHQRPVTGTVTLLLSFAAKATYEK